MKESVPIHRYHDAVDFLKAQAIEEFAQDNIYLSSPAAFTVSLDITIYTEKSTQVDK